MEQFNYTIKITNDRGTISYLHNSSKDGYGFAMGIELAFLWGNEDANEFLLQKVRDMLKSEVEFCKVEVIKVKTIIQEVMNNDNTKI